LITDIMLDGESVERAEPGVNVGLLLRGIRRKDISGGDLVVGEGVEVAPPDAEDQPKPRPGPALNLSARPFQPTESDRIHFEVSADHPSGVEEIAIIVNGRVVRRCPSDTCTFTSGPFAPGSITWQVRARSRDGGQTRTREQTITIRPEPTGHCRIVGHAAGRGAESAPAFFVTLSGPDDTGRDQGTKAFDAEGNFSFSNLPAGRYRLIVDTKGDLLVGVKPREQVVHCARSGTVEVTFTFE
jgi:hypothetical protein